MGGLERLFLRITPIFMLICFICLGITHTFDRNETHQITYLTHETVNVGTQESPHNITVYNFDTAEYVNNLDVDILRKATTNVISIDGYLNNFNSFKVLWQDGYQVGDIFKTMVNAILLVANTIITIINIFILPLRIISGILLTGLSLIGINISRNTIILKSLKALLNNGAIPLFNTTGTHEEYQDAAEQIEGIWEITRPEAISNANYTFNFYTYYEEVLYKQIIIENGTIIFVRYDNNEHIIVYENGQWNISQNYTVIDIGGVSTGTSLNILNMLNAIADKWDE